jgi:hypothetical protein
MNPEIYRLIAERDNTYNIWERKDDPDQETIFTEEELNAHYSTLASQYTLVPFPFFPFHSSNVFTELFSFTNVVNFKVTYGTLRLKSITVGLDGISLKFVKLILPLIHPLITHIFNTVLTKLDFPKSFKVKNPSTPADYRPISILPHSQKPWKS